LLSTVATSLTSFKCPKAKDFVPLKRAGEAQEVAEAICWLLSDKSSYTTGSFIDVSGGV
jgi:NAD(P)-dependent dehydrogenase (short-subunit alcohol dehydrogenase family)